MAREATIHIVSRNDQEEGISSDMKLQGTCYLKNDIYYVLYDSYESDGTAVTKNRLRIETNAVEVIRSGQTRTKLRFAEGSSHETEYLTEYGPLFLRFETRELRILRTEQRICIRIKYRIWTGDTILSGNEIEFDIRMGEEDTDDNTDFS